MKYQLTKEEQETHTVACAASDYSIVYSSIPSEREELLILCKQFPNNYKLIEDSKTEIHLEITPKKLAYGFKKPRNLTLEQRIAAAERMKKVRHFKK